MTDTPEAVRLADLIPTPVVIAQISALLRRFPELEAERDRLSAALATHPAQAQQVAGEVLTESYVQTVPDKCDRIVWRGYYYTLPPTPPAQAAADANGSA